LPSWPSRRSPSRRSCCHSSIGGGTGRARRRSTTSRCRTLAQLRSIRGTRFGTTPVETLRAVAPEGEEGEDRPTPDALLDAVLAAQRAGVGRQASDAGRRKKGAGVCAFRPTTTTFRIGPWKFDQDLPEETPFDETHIRDLPFFKFIHVDDRVAVAVGRSGGVALWTRMVE